MTTTRPHSVSTVPTLWGDTIGTEPRGHQSTPVLQRHRIGSDRPVSQKDVRTYAEIDTHHHRANRHAHHRLARERSRSVSPSATTHRGSCAQTPRTACRDHSEARLDSLPRLGSVSLQSGIERRLVRRWTEPIRIQWAVSRHIPDVHVQPIDVWTRKYLGAGTCRARTMVRSPLESVGVPARFHRLRRIPSGNTSLDLCWSTFGGHTQTQIEALLRPPRQSVSPGAKPRSRPCPTIRPARYMGRSITAAVRFQNRHVLRV